MSSVLDIVAKKTKQESICMVTAYDYWTARIIETSDIDMILVGDSLAMVMHGFEDTTHATIEMMQLHTAAVRRGSRSKFIVSDLPFLVHRSGLRQGMNAVERLVRAGANAVKLEGAKGNLKFISHVVESGIPVMGHLGLTPQMIHQLGGYKIQGRSKQQAEALKEEAMLLQQAGCFSLVLECVPSPLAAEISGDLRIPVIGIGAGEKVDGQVLVLHDLLGTRSDFVPKFVRRYEDLEQTVSRALSEYVEDVGKGLFPSEKELYK